MIETAQQHQPSIELVVPETDTSLPGEVFGAPLYGQAEPDQRTIPPQPPDSLPESIPELSEIATVETDTAPTEAITSPTEAITQPTQSVTEATQTPHPEFRNERQQLPEQLNVPEYLFMDSPSHISPEARIQKLLTQPELRGTKSFIQGLDTSLGASGDFLSYWERRLPQFDKLRTETFEFSPLNLAAREVRLRGEREASELAHSFSIGMINVLAKLYAADELEEPTESSINSALEPTKNDPEFWTEVSNDLKNPEDFYFRDFLTLKLALIDTILIIISDRQPHTVQEIIATTFEQANAQDVLADLDQDTIDGLKQTMAKYITPFLYYAFKNDQETYPPDKYGIAVDLDGTIHAHDSLTNQQYQLAIQHCHFLFDQGVRTLATIANNPHPVEAYHKHNTDFEAWIQALTTRWQQTVTQQFREVHKQAERLRTTLSQTDTESLRETFGKVGNRLAQISDRLGFNEPVAADKTARYRPPETEVTLDNESADPNYWGEFEPPVDQAEIDAYLEQVYDFADEFSIADKDLPMLISNIAEAYARLPAAVFGELMTSIKKTLELALSSANLNGVEINLYDWLEKQNQNENCAISAYRHPDKADLLVAIVQTIWVNLIDVAYPLRSICDIKVENGVFSIDKKTKSYKEDAENLLEVFEGCFKLMVENNVIFLEHTPFTFDQE